MHTHIKRLIRLGALAGCILPPTAIAAIMLQLPADAIVGLGFDVLTSGARSGDVVSISMETPTGKTIDLRASADAHGSATLPIRGRDTETAGTYRFVSGDGASATLDILPDTIDPALSTIDIWTPRIDNDGADSASVTVTLRDQYGNPLPGRIVTLVSGRSDDDVTSETRETDENGEQHFSVRTYEQGSITLRAIDLLSGIPLQDSATIRSGDSAMGGTESAVPVSRTSGGTRFYYAQVAGFDVIDGFEIDAPETLRLGEEAPSITVRAVDRDGNTVEDYVGTVLFSSTDPDAVLPNFGRYAFKERDLGRKAFPLVLSFKQPGDQTFRVEDQNDRTIFGNVVIAVEGSAARGGTITILSPKDGASVGGQSVTIVGTGPAFTNLIVLGGAEDTRGSTDAEGRFSIPVRLRADQRDYTIRVQDEDRRYDSGPILLHLDTDAPVIDTITFNPDVPDEGEKVLVVVKAEPGLATAVLTITQRLTSAVQEITLNESTTASGTYQGFFTAPVRDQYQPKLVVTDVAGNTTELRTTLTVGSMSLPTVTNVAAEARVNGVTVSWKEVDDPNVTGYRVYVGKESGVFDASLDTEQRTDRATVAGLEPGTQYFFAVTALGIDRESEKSDVVSASAIGMALVATPQDHGLLLQWTTLDSETALSHYMIEYGLDGEPPTEKRLVNRELTEISLSDLLNGIAYAVRITPVTITGKVLTELAGTATGIPSGEGFHPSAGDTFDVNLHPGALPSSAPNTPSSGIPAVLGWTMLAAGVLGGWYHLRRRAERQRTVRFLASLPHAR